MLEGSQPPGGKIPAQLFQHWGGLWFWQAGAVLLHGQVMRSRAVCVRTSEPCPRCVRQSSAVLPLLLPQRFSAAEGGRCVGGEAALGALLGVGLCRRCRGAALPMELCGSSVSPR